MRLVSNNNVLNVNAFLQKCAIYFLLLKPSILLLIIITSIPSLILEGSLLHSPLHLILILSGILLCGGAANIINQIWDSDIDAIMDRTKNKRPIPRGLVIPLHALYLSIICCATALMLLLIFGNTLSVILGIIAIICYALYTIVFKRNSRLHIIVGGIAGALPPCIAWAASANSLGITPLLMSFIVFLWSIPHFWSLVLFRIDEYAQVGIPVHPLQFGERHTRIQIVIYNVLVVVTVVFLGIIVKLGWLYFVGTTMAGIILLWKTARLLISKEKRSALSLFRFSIVYLTVVFSLMLTGGTTISQ